MRRGYTRDVYYKVSEGSQAHDFASVLIGEDLGAVDPGCAVDHSICNSSELNIA